jgi:DDE_Tnp_1-associated
MNLTIVDPVEEVAPGPFPIDPTSLYHAFAQVQDGRKRRGKRYPVALILTLSMLGKRAGETTISGIVDWVKLRETG